MHLKKKVLITGGDGYIGRHLTNYLKKKKIKYFKIDIEKNNNYKFKNYTHFVHLQFYVKNNKKNVLKNYKNLCKVIKICVKNNIFLIFSSTASLRFKNKKRLSNNINVFNYYTRSKNQCENMILESKSKKNLKYTILRIFNVYGEDINNKSHISNIINEFKKPKIKINIKHCDNVRDFIHVKDLCGLIYKITNINKVGTFEAASGKNISIKNLVIKIKKLFKIKKTIYFANPKSSNFNSYSKSNIKKTINTFRWKPKISLDSGLKKLVFDNL